MDRIPRMGLPGLAIALLLLAGCPPGDDDDAADDDAGDDDAGDDDTGDDDSAGDDDTGDDDTGPPEDDVYIWPPLAFPDTPLGCMELAEVAIYNQGDDPVVIGDAGVDPGGEHFSLLPPAAWPITIYPGFDLPVDVAFHPGQPDAQEGTLTAETDHPDHETVTLDVEGVGLSAGEQTDTFEQSTTDQVDLLWVVDNSCSMTEEQQFLADNAAAFIGFLVKSGVDYQIGVATTDSGHLQGAVPIIDSSAKDPAGAFAEAVLLGTNGSATERPLQFGHEALTPPLMAPGGPNEGFVREDAGLAIVILTDEPDQSPGDAAAWIGQFEALKPDPGRVVVSGIYGMTTGCNNANAGPKIHDVIVGTGGTEALICDKDWMPALTPIPGMVSGPATHFPLSEKAMPLTLEVTVDGTPVTSGWIYDEPSNSVVFEPASIPEPGSEIEIHYHFQGEC